MNDRHGTDWLQLLSPEPGRLREMHRTDGIRGLSFGEHQAWLFSRRRQLHIVAAPLEISTSSAGDVVCGRASTAGCGVPSVGYGLPKIDDF
jgi:hypothetical protein